jgi:flagellar P-ring protein precursor FlgI
VDSKNSAAVVVSATLPPFTKAGSQIDVTLAAIGTATQLDGGTLMMTSLRGADGKIYAMAHGKILPLKRESKGGGGGGGQASVPTWLVPSGATIEKENEWDFSQVKELKYQLTVPDFTTAVRISKRINDELGGKYATPVDASTIDIIYPYTFDGNPVELIAQIEGIEVETDRRAKVVINSKTGTVVLGDQVRIAAVAIAHNNLKVEVKEEPRTPAATETPNKDSKNATPPPAGEAKEGGEGKNKKLILMDQGSTISEIVSGLNDMGASSDDLVALIQALKTAGALMAEVEMQ